VQAQGAFKGLEKLIPSYKEIITSTLFPSWQDLAPVVPKHYIRLHPKNSPFLD